MNFMPPPVVTAKRPMNSGRQAKPRKSLKKYAASSVGARQGYSDRKKRLRNILFQAVVYSREKIDETTAETLTYTAHALKHLDKYQESNNYFIARSKPMVNTSMVISAPANYSPRNISTPRQPNSSMMR